MIENIDSAIMFNNLFKFFKLLSKNKNTKHCSTALEIVAESS